MTQTIDIDGMHCSSCEQRVSDALESVDGVASASADADEGVARVNGDADTEALVAAVEDADFDPSA